MKAIFILIFIFLLSITAFTSNNKDTTSNWQKDASISINLSNQIFDNWTSGGENATTWNCKVNSSMEYNKSLLNWKNTGKFEYGQTRLGESDFLKSLDEFYLETILKYKVKTILDFYATANFVSQTTKSYSYEIIPKTTISNLMDPGYTSQSFGIGLQKINNFTTRLGLSIKETFSAKYGFADYTETVNEIEKLRVEPGLESVSEYSYKKDNLLNLNTKLKFFINFKGLKEIDTKWENTLTIQLAKYLNVNIGLDLLYDRNLSLKRQIKQSTALGLNYSL